MALYAMNEIERMMLIGGAEFTKFDAILIALGFLMICCMVAL